jgi:hypothetical protein
MISEFLGWFWSVMFGWLITVVNCDQVVQPIEGWVV